MSAQAPRRYMLVRLKGSRVSHSGDDRSEKKGPVSRDSTEEVKD